MKHKKGPIVAPNEEEYAGSQEGVVVFLKYFVATLILGSIILALVF